MNYEGQICRGPMERSSYMLPVAVGCSYNRCKFCTLFRHLKYRELPMEQIEAELARVRNLGGNPMRVFLGDGNAFGLGTNTSAEDNRPDSPVFSGLLRHQHGCHCHQYPGQIPRGAAGPSGGRYTPSVFGH